MSMWKRWTVEDMAGVFSRGGKLDGPTETDELHTNKNAKLDRDHPDLRISEKCRLMWLSRSAFYFAPVVIQVATLALMKVIDRVYTKYPFLGSRQIVVYLRREGAILGRHRVRSLMAKIDLEAMICEPPKTSQLHPQHPSNPHLLRGPQIEQPNQVWRADITFIPVRHRFLYSLAIIARCSPGDCRTR